MTHLANVFYYPIPYLVEDHKQVKVAGAVVLSSGDRAEHDHSHGIERRHYIFDNVGTPVAHGPAIPQPVDIARLLTHTGESTTTSAPAPG